MSITFRFNCPQCSYEIEFEPTRRGSKEGIITCPNCGDEIDEDTAWEIAYEHAKKNIKEKLGRRRLDVGDLGNLGEADLGPEAKADCLDRTYEDALAEGERGGLEAQAVWWRKSTVRVVTVVLTILIFCLFGLLIEVVLQILPFPSHPATWWRWGVLRLVFSPPYPYDLEFDHHDDPNFFPFIAVVTLVGGGWVLALWIVRRFQRIVHRLRGRDE